MIGFELVTLVSILNLSHVYQNIRNVYTHAEGTLEYSNHGATTQVLVCGVNVYLYNSQCWKFLLESLSPESDCRICLKSYPKIMRILGIFFYHLRNSQQLTETKRKNRSLVSDKIFITIW